MNRRTGLWSLAFLALAAAGAWGGWQAASIGVVTPMQQCCPTDCCPPECCPDCCTQAKTQTTAKTEDCCTGSKNKVKVEECCGLGCCGN